MTIAPAISALTTMVRAAVSTPNVYGHMPLQPDMTLLRAAVLHDSRIHFYVVRRPAVSLGQHAANFTAFDHRLHVEGWLAYADDASQALIDADSDALLSSIAANPTLSGTVIGIEDVRLAVNEPYALYNYAVHYARIELEVRDL